MSQSKILIAFVVLYLSASVQAQFVRSRKLSSDFQQVGSEIVGESPADISGFALAMNSVGDVVAIGARYNDDGGANAGHVRVYRLDGSTWVQAGNDLDGDSVGDDFGFSVAVNGFGNVLVVGGRNNDGGGSSAGHVRVYTWDGSAWAQRGTDIYGKAAGDQSGYSVATSSVGDRVIIGAQGNADAGEDAGHARIFSYDGTSWIQVGGDLTGENAGDLFGSSVSMNSAGDRVAVGGIGNNNETGFVRVFEDNGTSTWVQIGSDISGDAPYDLFGDSVSLSATGDHVAIGAPLNDGTATDAGLVRVYTYNGSAWTQMGNDISGEAEDDEFGFAVALSGDGLRLVVGGYNNDDAGNNAGHVRVFDFDGTDWVQLAADLDGTTAGESFGLAVAISAEGDRIVVGTPYYNTGAGAVRVYDVLNSATSSPTTSPAHPNNATSSSNNSNNLSPTTIATIVVPIVGVVALLAALLAYKTCYATSKIAST